MYICRWRLNPFNSEDSLNMHIESCSMHDAVKKIVMPKEGSTIKFKNFFRKMRVPFVVEVDFDCITKKLDTCQPNNKKSYTKQYQKHTPSGFC